MNGFVRVPQYVRKTLRPTVSKTRARAPTAMVSRGRFSVKIWAMNCADISHWIHSWTKATYRGSGAGKEDECSEVSGALVGQSAGGVDQSTNTVSLNSGSDERGAPGKASRGGLARLEKLLLGVGGLGLAVGVTEQGGQDGEGSDVVEDGAEGDGRRLDRGQV